MKFKRLTKYPLRGCRNDLVQNSGLNLAVPNGPSSLALESLIKNRIRAMNMFVRNSKWLFDSGVLKPGFPPISLGRTCGCTLFRFGVFGLNGSNEIKRNRNGNSITAYSYPE